MGRLTSFAAAVALLAAAPTALASGPAAGPPSTLPPSVAPTVPQTSDAAAAPAVEAAGVRTAAESPTSPGRATLPDPAARLPRDGSASEYWDLVAEFSDGHLLSARILVTNAGPGDRNAVAVGMLMPPDAPAIRYHNARREERWELSDDGRRFQIGKTGLDLRGTERVYRITKGRIQIELRFAATGGRALPSSSLPAGYEIDLIDLGASASGWYQRGGDEARTELRDGAVSLVHTISHGEEAERVRRRIDLFELDPAAPLYLLGWLSPNGDTGHFVSLGASDGTSDDFVSSQFELALMGSASGWKNQDYWVPARMAVTGPLAGEGVGEIEGGVEIGPILQEEDTLGDLPQPFRWILAMKMRPRRVWAGADFEVRLPARPESSPRIAQGDGLVIFNFLDELSRENVPAGR